MGTNHGIFVGSVPESGVNGGFSTTATAAGTTTLTVTSNQIQEFTGSTTQSVVLPAVSTLPQTGFYFVVINNSTGVVTVKSSGSNTIVAMPAGSTVTFVANVLSGTGASVWSWYSGTFLPLNTPLSSANGPMMSANSGPGIIIGGSGSGAISLLSSLATWYFNDWPGGTNYMSLTSAGLGVGVGKLSVPTTVTTGGTTGNQTINKASGTVNFAASASSLTVTNSLVTANSIVFAVVRTNDSTAVIKNVVSSSGSFVITLNAAATAETSVGFFVVN